MGKPKISLVLGGGGARGFTHIGVIERLKKEFEIVSIAGTSIGALVGGLEAVGKLEEYKNWLSNMEFTDMVKYLQFNMKLGEKRVNLNLEKIFHQLEQWTSGVKIEDLPIKYTAVAVDLSREREVWFQKGDLLTAIRASIAIPGIFPPVEMEGRTLVDGGILNLLPVGATIPDESDLVVAVDLFGDRPIASFSFPLTELEGLKLSHQIWNRFFREKNSVMERAISLMMEVIFRYRQAEFEPDIHIKIPKDVAKWYEFYKAKPLIEVGYFIAEEYLHRYHLRQLYQGRE
jgi:NTE family protein